MVLPNSAVRADIERAVVDTATVNGAITAELGDALQKFDFAAFETGLNALVDVQRWTASLLWTVPELLVALNSDALTRADRANSALRLDILLDQRQWPELLRCD